MAGLRVRHFFRAKERKRNVFRQIPGLPFALVIYKLIIYNLNVTVPKVQIHRCKVYSGILWMVPSE